ncbi:ExbD/TolR family protein [Pontibacter roseus]|uniref:ExbD/TolR family protein n=1 Tax=Pontibacter roseus TaxID=336989 RepID=UPI000372045B|nr:biopolymer transporter ExbD [Pontibacter roseus]
MAQLQENSAPRNGGKKLTKKRTTHLDMTPMVDLASLLLTFFILTTTFARLQTMELNMPVPKGDATAVAAKDALTLVLAGKDKVYYYFGFSGDRPEVHETDYSSTGLRKLLLTEQVKSNKNRVVLIKATEASRYKNIVDVLDEMRLTETRMYALAALQEEDKALLEEKLVAYR